jgi:hypothetical protein
MPNLLKKRRRGVKAEGTTLQGQNEPVEEEDEGQTANLNNDDETLEAADDDETMNAQEEEEEEQQAAAPALDPVAVERQRCHDINAAFADNVGFAREAIAKGWSVTEAKAIAFDRGVATPAAPKAEATEDAAGNAPLERVANPKLAHRPATGGAGRSAFAEAIDAKMAECPGMSRARASSLVHRESPELAEDLCAQA